MSQRCNKNPKRFLFFKYRGSHKNKVVRARDFGYSLGGLLWWSGYFYEAQLKCENCGVEHNQVASLHSLVIETGQEPYEIMRLKTDKIVD